MKKILAALLLIALVGDAAFLIQNFWPETPAAGCVDKAVELIKSAIYDSTSAEPAAEEAPKTVDQEPAVTEPEPETAPEENPVEEPVVEKTPEGPWKNLEPENWYYGPKVSEKDFKGKAVLIYQFSAKERDSVEMLPRVQDLCLAYKPKGLLAIASHRGGANPKIKTVAQKLKLKIPVYEGAGRTTEPVGSAYPAVYIVDDTGRVYDCGQDINVAVEKFVSVIWPRLGKSR